MTMACPRCYSSRVVTRNNARKAGGAIGAIAGAASSFGLAMKGAGVGSWLGGRVGLIAGPPGAAVGTITGAVLGALAGGAAGCSAGSALGEMIDAKILDNYRCLDCAHTFAQPSGKTDRGCWQSPDESDESSFGSEGFDRFRTD